jgi:Domain of unknown function (DUF4351)
MKLLTKRFGALSAAAEARVRGAGTAQLDGIAERVLTANTLDEILDTI